MQITTVFWKLFILNSISSQVKCASIFLKVGSKKTQENTEEKIRELQRDILEF
jgi:hypothetical protein